MAVARNVPGDRPGTGQRFPELRPGNNQACFRIAPSVWQLVVPHFAILQAQGAPELRSGNCR